MAKATKPNDNDYVALDNALGGVQTFQKAIRWQLAQRGINPSAVDSVISAMQDLHSGDLDDACAAGEFKAGRIRFRPTT